jgi:DNA-binding GntR family transcriptional regulator
MNKDIDNKLKMYYRGIKVSLILNIGYIMEEAPARKPISNPPLSVRERTYRELKAAIFSGKFSPGERLAEEQIAAELAVSRTPVREALHRLEQDGFIETLGKRGFCIPENSQEELEDVFALRTVLEGYALRLICKRITDEQIDILQEVVDKAEAALLQGKVDELFQCNTMFHDALLGLVAHKRRFHGFIVNMRKYVLRYRKDTLRNLGAGKRCVDGHRMLLGALKLRDEELCEQIMKRHVQDAGEDALQINREES